MVMTRSRLKRLSVDARALQQRINRILAKRDDPERLEKSRPGSRLRQSVGEYYMIDLHRNALVGSHVDLEAFGREVGALKLYEALAGNED